MELEQRDVGMHTQSGTMVMSIAPNAGQSTDCLEENPGGILGTAELLVDPSLPGVVNFQDLHHHHGGDVSIGRCPSHEANAWARCSPALTQIW